MIEKEEGKYRPLVAFFVSIDGVPQPKSSLLCATCASTWCAGFDRAQSLLWTLQFACLYWTAVDECHSKALVGVGRLCSLAVSVFFSFQSSIRGDV